MDYITQIIVLIAAPPSLVAPGIHIPLLTALYCVLNLMKLSNVYSDGSICGAYGGVLARGLPFANVSRGHYKDLVP